MRALAVVESLWGNMAQTARDIADELAKRMPVDLLLGAAQWAKTLRPPARRRSLRQIRAVNAQAGA